MFRRNRPLRGPRRPLRKLMGTVFNPNGALAAEARQAFDEANRLYDNGKYSDAAGQFAELADTATQFNRPRRAAQLHMRAYESWLKAKEPQNALQHARGGISIALVRGHIRPALNMTQTVIADLRAAGYAAEAEAFSKEINSRLAGHKLPLVSAGTAATQPKKLPTACPQCGGRLPRSYGEDELECDYCGSIIRGE